MVDMFPNRPERFRTNLIPAKWYGRSTWGSEETGSTDQKGRIRQATARLIGSTLGSPDRMASSRSAHSCIIWRRGSRYCALL